MKPLIVELVGVVLAMAVSTFIVVAMWVGAAGATPRCDLYEQPAAGPTWVCQDGVR